MPSVLSQALSNLQQTAEDYAKNREEAQKAQFQAAGNRNMLNTLVNAGIWGDQEVIQFNKANDRGRNDMVAAGARALLLKSQVEDQQLQREAAKRAAEQLALGQRSQQFEEEKYAAAIKQRAAEAEAARKFVEAGPQVATVPGTAVPGAAGPEGIPQRAMLTREGGFTMLPESSEYKAAVHEREQLEKAKALSETKVQMRDPVTGKQVLVDPESKVYKEYTEQLRPEIKLERKYNLRPQDMFDSATHQAGKLEGTKFTPDDQGPYIAVSGKPMPRSEFREFQQKLIDVGLGPKPSQAPESMVAGRGSGISWGPPMGTSAPAWQRQRQSGGGVAPAGGASGPVRINSDEDYRKLDSGTVFIGPDGKQRTKP
jgi:hypothetical protein